MSVLTAVPKYAKLGEGFSGREVLASYEHPGRRTDGTQSAATWMTDLTSLRKVILLCTYCRAQFNPRRHGYRKFYTPDLAGATDGYMHNGRCDACKQETAMIPGGGTSFVPEETYRLVCLDPLDARRKARAAARALGAWGRITRERATRRAPEAARGHGR